MGNNIQNLLFIWGAVNLIPTLKWNPDYFLAELLAANQTFINSHILSFLLYFFGKEHIYIFAIDFKH